MARMDGPLRASRGRLLAFLVGLPAFGLTAAGGTGGPDRLVAGMVARPISVNGDLTDWEGIPAFAFAGVGVRGERANGCQARVAWDARKLYVAFEVHDTTLFASRLEDAADLYADDAVELFVDRGYQHGSTMEDDDFHLLCSIGGSVAFARGSEKLRRQEQWQVPQEFGHGSDVLRFVRLHGTLNDAAPDTGYTVELALSWDDIGGLPRAGEVIGMDFGVDDRDTPVLPVEGAPEDPSSYEPFALSGVTDWGYPKDWLAVTFEGRVPLRVRIAAALRPTRLAGAAAGMLGLVWLSGVRRRRRARATLMRLKEELAVLRTARAVAPPVAPPAAESVPDVSPVAASAPVPTVEPPPPPPPEPTPPRLLRSADVVPALPPLEPTLADRIADHLREHHADPLTMEQVARDLGLSAKTMERALKRQGTTYSDLLTEIRMERARELLLRTERTITEIAFDVGYNDSSYFTRVFRKHYGMTPRDLRKAWDTARATA